MRIDAKLDRVERRVTLTSWPSFVSRYSPAPRHRGHPGGIKPIHAMGASAGDAEGIDQEDVLTGRPTCCRRDGVTLILEVEHEG
jgi:hypothetical protein